MPRDKRHPALASGRALDTLRTLSDLPAPLRENLLALAGVTPKVLAKRIRRAFRVMTEAMRAERVQRLVVPGAKGEGASVEEFTDIDFSTRLQAADLLLKVAGVFPARASAGASESAAGQVVNVNVTLRDMSHPASVVPVVIDADGKVIAHDSKREANVCGTLDAQPPAGGVQ